MRIKNEKNVDDPVSNWENYPGCQRISVNRNLFESGILLVKPNYIKFDEKSLLNTDYFVFSGRKLQLKEKNELNRLNIKQHIGLLELIKSISNNSFEYSSTRVIANESRRDEVFIPIKISEKLGSYFYPWIKDYSNSNLSIDSFSGFRKFCTAGCMFGSNLVGIDQFGFKIGLIKHDIKFSEDQKIQEVVFDNQAFNVYEEIFLQELEKICNFINIISLKKENKNLFVHLPYYDYIVFGINLFLNKRLTYTALRDFIEIVKGNVKNYISKINSICQSLEISISTISPFDLAFGNLIFDENINDLTKSILELMNIPLDYENNHCILSERFLVQQCINLLQESKDSTGRKDIWNNSLSDFDQIKNIEELFRIANSVVIGFTAQGTKNYETCSFLPVSEKQIQISYSKHSGTKKLPHVFNITTLDPMFGCAKKNHIASMFYFDEYQDSLEKLICEHRILEKSSENIIYLASNKSINLDSIGLFSNQLKREKGYNVGKNWRK